ncbi:MAG: hypothetical protein ACOC3I_11145 [Verrucomicrobiota bacterium]
MTSSVPLRKAGANTRLPLLMRYTCLAVSGGIFLGSAGVAIVLGEPLAASLLGVLAVGHVFPGMLLRCPRCNASALEAHLDLGGVRAPVITAWLPRRCRSCRFRFWPRSGAGRE